MLLAVYIGYMTLALHVIEVCQESIASAQPADQMPSELTTNQICTLCTHHFTMKQKRTFLIFLQRSVFSFLFNDEISV